MAWGNVNNSCIRCLRVVPGPSLLVLVVRHSFQHFKMNTIAGVILILEIDTSIWYSPIIKHSWQIFSSSRKKTPNIYDEH